MTDGARSMNRSDIKWPFIIGGILLLCVLAFAVGAAIFTGVGPFPSETSEPITDFPSDDQIDEDSSEDPAFSFVVDDVQECGMTCQDVTATLHNNQNETATGVTGYIRIFAGSDNTDTDDLVWEGTEEIGTIEAGRPHTTTKRVELSVGDARKVDRENGWITILTVVKTDQKTVRFRESEQVA